jgi:NTE family protein
MAIFKYNILLSDSILRRIYPRLILIISGVIVFSASIFAQASPERPKIGLVLSGGGSHGIAHVGVIKVMEEAGLRPDIITGTSMGSIIGGLYSLGYSSDSLIKILKTMNWDLLLSNSIPQNKIFFPEKKYFNNSAMSLPLSSKKVRLPSGLISGQHIENSLSYYAWPAADIRDFTKFPIPFTCVGADLLKVRKVDIKSGYLADAMRASSAIPTVFSPLKIDTALLSDGGLINNFPAEEAKNLGADILIGSYVGFRPLSEYDLNTIPGIIQQIGFSRSVEDYNRQKKMINFLITPIVKPYQILDFKQVDSIVAIGYRAALPYKAQFKKIADSLNRIGSQKPVMNILDKQYYIFDKVEVTGNKIIPDGQVLGLLGIRPGEKADKNKMFENIELLYGMNWFEKIKYRVEPRADSLILVVECTEKPKTMFYGSAHYDNALGSALLMAATVKNMFLQGSQFNISTSIGQYYRAEITASQSLGGNHKFVLSAEFKTDKTLIPVQTIMGEAGDWKSVNMTTGIGIDRVLGLNHLLGISASLDNRFLFPSFVSAADIRHFGYNYFTSEFRYLVNSLDNRHFPEQGNLLELKAGVTNLMSANIKAGKNETDYKPGNPGQFTFGSFYTAKLRWEHYFRTPGAFTISIKTNLLFLSRCDSISAQNNFYQLGGITEVNDRSISMRGFHPNEIAIKQMAGIGIGFDWKLAKDLHLNIDGDIAGIREANATTGYSLLAGYGIGLGYMSILGPVRAGIMQGFYSKEVYFSKFKGYISVGFSF